MLSKVPISAKLHIVQRTYAHPQNFVTHNRLVIFNIELNIQFVTYSVENATYGTTFFFLSKLLPVQIVTHMSENILIIHVNASTFVCELISLASG